MVFSHRALNLPRANELSYLTVVSDTPDNFIGRSTLGDGVEYFLRKRKSDKAKVINQSYLKFWLFVRFYNVQPNSLSLCIEDRFVQPHGNFCVFMPMKSFFVWSSRAGSFQYENYMSSQVPDTIMQGTPLLFQFDKPDIIRGADDICTLLKRHRDSEIAVVRARSYVADKTKLFLENNYTENLSFEDVAKELNFSVSTMTHTFKNYFGIPPIQYRSMLRTYQALHHITEGLSVTDAGYMAGFGSLTQYNDHFLKNLGVSPSTFSKKNKKTKLLQKSGS